MPVASKTPYLELVPSVDSVSGSLADGTFRIPPERELDRQVLVDISPDREEILQEPISEVRKLVKLDGCEAIWLNEHLDVQNAKPQGRTMRRSALLCDHSPNVLGRCFSAFSLGSEDEEAMSDDAKLGMTTEDVSAMTPALASTATISPRPLGPTHVLVCYTDQPTSRGIYRHLIELPVNDLVLALNCPNLDIMSKANIMATKRSKMDRKIKSWPTRSLLELPRMMLRVKDLETFPELVRFFHAEDLEGLFEAVLIAPWLQETLKPLLDKADLLWERTQSARQDNREKSSDAEQNVCPPVTARAFGHVTLPLRAATSVLYHLNGSLVSLAMTAVDLTMQVGTLLPKDSSPRSASPESEPHCTAESGCEMDLLSMAAVASRVAQTAEGEREQDLEQALRSLAGLRANLECLGHYEVFLWTRLQVAWEVLVRAINLRSRVDGYESEGMDEKE